MQTSMRLRSTESSFVFEPTSPPSNNNLVIDRTTGSISQKSSVSSSYDPHTKVDDVYGIIGTVKLLSGSYLVIITGRRLIGKINGHDIWRVARTKIIPYQSDTVKLSPIQQADEQQYLKMLSWVLGLDGFYFSYTYDVTHSMQRIHDMSAETKSKPLWTRVDPRFWWNRHMLQDLINMKLDEYILPVMMGFVEIHNCEIFGNRFDFALISRRHVKRVGTRYFVRGVDAEGNVANSVETEQILLYGKSHTSFVQTRGSIPLFWKQTPNLKYKPKPVIHGTEIETPPAFRRHMDELSRHYSNKVVAINLIDQKGSELVLANAFEIQARQYGGNLKYIAFDFHHQCKNMRWDRLSILIEQVHDEIEKIGFFFVQEGKVMKRQEGIFRTNCIDNLDRTNVVQSLLDRESLNQQLAFLGVTPNAPTSAGGFSPDFEHRFKNVWANHADVVSLQYSGTGALKTDFTRTGKRTTQGTLNDGINSLTRYYLNNFQDGFRQDAFDLFLGNYVPSSNEKSPFKENRVNAMYLLVAAGFLFVCSMMAPTEGGVVVRGGILAVWGMVLFVAYRVTLKYGNYLVNRPMLHWRD